MKRCVVTRKLLVRTIRLAGDYLLRVVNKVLWAGWSRQESFLSHGRPWCEFGSVASQGLTWACRVCCCEEAKLSKGLRA